MSWATFNTAVSTVQHQHWMAVMTRGIPEAQPSLECIRCFYSRPVSATISPSVAKLSPVIISHYKVSYAGADASIKYWPMCIGLPLTSQNTQSPEGSTDSHDTYHPLPNDLELMTSIWPNDKKLTTTGTSQLLQQYSCCKDNFRWSPSWESYFAEKNKQF